MVCPLFRERPLTHQSQGIAPTLVIVRVGLGRVAGVRDAQPSEHVMVSFNAATVGDTGERREESVYGEHMHKEATVM